jgi:hypothetical protein
MKIAHGPFAGMKPGLESHLLGANEAQLAVNCHFDRGDLRPLRAPLRVQTFTPLTIKSIYPYAVNSTVYWIATEEDCDYAKSPIRNDTYERLFFTGKTEPRFFANDNITAGGLDPDVDYIKLGIPKPTTAITVARVGAAGAIYRSYLYIFLNSYGQEGSNSPTDAISDYLSGRMTIDGIEDAPANCAIDRIWLYRTNSSATSAEYQFVCEAFYFSTTRAFAVGEFCVYNHQLYECTTDHAAGAWNAANFTAGEQVPDSALGDVFYSEHYLVPPADLTALVQLSNGAMAGISGEMVCFSEPYEPHAWPMAYRRTCRFTPVALAPLGTDVMVATVGKPVRWYGQHPDSMAPYDIEEWLPCPVSYKRSISVYQGAVYWASTHGLAGVSLEAAGVATAGFINDDVWSNYAPLFGDFHAGEYIGFTADHGVIIDFKTGTVVKVGLNAHASCVSPVDGLFYLATDDPDAVSASTPAGVMPLALKLWEGDTTNFMFATWKSRLNLQNHQVNMGYCRVVLNEEALTAMASLVDLATLNAAIFAGDIGGAIGDGLVGEYIIGGDDMYDLQGFTLSTDVEIKFYGDRQLIHTEIVSGIESVFSLPADDEHTRHEIEISGYVPVSLLVMAPSIDEVFNYG